MALRQHQWQADLSTSTMEDTCPAMLTTASWPLPHGAESKRTTSGITPTKGAVTNQPPNTVAAPPQEPIPHKRNAIHMHEAQCQAQQEVLRDSPLASSGKQPNKKGPTCSRLMSIRGPGRSRGSKGVEAPMKGHDQWPFLSNPYATTIRSTTCLHASRSLHPQHMPIFTKAIHMGAFTLFSDPITHPARLHQLTVPAINHTVGAMDQVYGNAAPAPAAYGRGRPKHPLVGWRTTDGRNQDGTAEQSESNIPLTCHPI